MPFQFLVECGECSAVMFVSRVYGVIQDPAVLIAGRFDSIGKDLLVFSLVEPPTFRICRTLLLFFHCRFFEGRSPAAARGRVIVILVNIILVFQWFLSVCSSICVDLFTEFFVIETCFLLRYEDLLGFLPVCGGLNMSRIYKHGIGVHKIVFHALQKYLLEDLLEEIRSFESSFVVLAECTEVWNFVIEIQSQEPSVRNIDLNFFDRLPHTFYAEHILDDRDLDERHGIDARPSRFGRIFFFHKIIDEIEIDCSVDLP